ncbi:MAG: LiaF-related protein [Bacteroidia bacterium]|nr:LiaF-related protein [Bacteroidia bacterium]
MKIGNVLIALLFIGVGVLWLLSNYGLVDLTWIHQINIKKIFFPALFIVVGFGVLRNAMSRTEKSGDETGEKEQPKSECDVLLCGRTMNYSGQRFESLSCKTLLGGAEIDLRGAEIAENATIYINALLGGAEIRVDKDVTVEIRSHCILGGVNDERRNVSASAGKRLIIDATCMFGGVNIK